MNSSIIDTVYDRQFRHHSKATHEAAKVLECIWITVTALLPSKTCQMKLLKYSVIIGIQHTAISSEFPKRPYVKTNKRDSHSKQMSTIIEKEGG
jgi:hypothetical protein